MIRKISWLALGGLLVTAACADPETDKRIAELENKIEELESTRPVARTAPNDAAEQAGAELLRQATKASEEMDYDEAKRLVAELRSKYPTSRAARSAQRMDEELSVIGKPAGELEVEKWFQGSLAGIDNNKATLLVFWEVWCPHCKREVPKLTETYEKYHSQGLDMVGLTKLSRNTTESAVEEFIRETNVGYPIAKEVSDNMSNYFGVRGVPAAAMVKDGKVVWRGHPARLTDSMIEGWL